MLIRQIAILGAGVGLVIVLAGCSDAPPLARVNGVLTYKGKPVQNVQVNLLPEKGRPSWGLTDAEGRFTLEYDKDNKGATLGKHKVSVRMGPGPQTIPDGSAPAELADFFEKYGNNSTVVVEIEAGTKELKLAWD